MAVNHVELMGRLTKDVDVRSITTGRGKERNTKSVCDFTVAVDRRYNRDESDFIRCTAWGALADVIAKHFYKGRMIHVSGELHIDKYEDKNGDVKYSTTVVVSDFSFCGDKER